MTTLADYHTETAGVFVVWARRSTEAAANAQP